MTEPQVAQIVLLLTTVGGFAAQAWREARNRRWAIADRKADLDATADRIIAEARARADALLIETDARTRALHLEQIARAEELQANLAVHDEWERSERDAATASVATVVSLIGEAKVAAESAYQEANNVNVKIENLNARLAAAEHVPPSKGIRK